ncbi:hypothetical protein ILUMI_21905 [Ignelater luminosus]|uniref:Uncharacterized protein n=1 Tax=Ignelater luminosus TaxID=2038154 RepID=A0A8K0CGT2_IGNLU|nr:hypothetical protein ILUMI_21905 [Ignelater luminosus]
MMGRKVSAEKSIDVSTYVDIDEDLETESGNLTIVDCVRELNENNCNNTVKDDNDIDEEIQITTVVTDMKDAYTKLKDLEAYFILFSDSENYFPSEQSESDSDEPMKHFEKPKSILSDVTIHPKHKSNWPYLVPHVDNANNVIQANKDENVKNSTAVTSTLLSDTEQHMQAVLVDIINTAVQKSERKLCSKQGELRKRRKFDESPTEKKKIKKEQYINNHKVKGACNCKLKCSTNLTPSRQAAINQQY